MTYFRAVEIRETIIGLNAMGREIVGQSGWLSILQQGPAALRNAMNYSFRPDRARRDVGVIPDKLAIPHTSVKLASFLEK